MVIEHWCRLGGSQSRAIVKWDEIDKVIYTKVPTYPVI